MKIETRQESSISVQSRISMNSLAELDMYWISEGKGIKTVSQLVSWSLDLLCEILKANEKMPGNIETVREARNYLELRALIQPSLHRRNFNKIGSAIKFEGMRENGDDPSKELIDSEGEIANSNVIRQYRILHNKNSVQPFGGRVFGDKIKKAVEIYNSIDINQLGKTELTEGLNKPLVKDKMTPEEAAEVIKANEEIAQRDLDALNSLDLSTLSPITEQKEGE